MSDVVCESKLRSVVRVHPYIHAQETGWQSVVQFCITLGLPMHLVQGLNVSTVHIQLAHRACPDGRPPIRPGLNPARGMWERCQWPMSRWWLLPVILFPPTHLQCGHLSPALNAWAARAKYTTAWPISTHFPGHWCVDCLKTERSFGLQVTCVIDVLGWYFWHVIHGRLFEQTLADVRLTGAGINWLYCNWLVELKLKLKFQAPIRMPHMELIP